MATRRAQDLKIQGDAEYSRAVEANAREILEGYEIEDEDSLEQAISETAESAAATYYMDSFNVLINSSNWTAIDDVMGGDFAKMLSQAAVLAYEQDLREVLERIQDEGSDEE